MDILKGGMLCDVGFGWDFEIITTKKFHPDFNSFLPAFY